MEDLHKWFLRLYDKLISDFLKYLKIVSVYGF